jgi:hypothetical protein
MWKYRNKPLSWVFVSRMIGIICFLIVVVLAKILTAEGILFANFWLLLLIAIILFIADIFGAFPFPLNLPAPIIRAFGSAFCIAFILIVFSWVDGISGTTLYQFFWFIPFTVVPLVFLIVLASGYYEIMRQLWWQPNLEHETGSDTLVFLEETPGQATQTVSDAKSWEEIGLEFRLMLFDIIHRFREDIQKKK